MLKVTSRFSANLLKVIKRKLPRPLAEGNRYHRVYF